MSYNTLDLIDKAIMLAEKRKNIYYGIYDRSENKQDQLVIKVLIRLTMKDVDRYVELKSALEKDPIEDIDFLVYDSAANLINNFVKSFLEPSINSLSDLLEFAISVEEKTYALFIDIQGRIYQNEKKDDSQVYVALNKLIERKKTNVESIKFFYDKM
ncbi:MAG: hypothetical protein N4A76_10110 [Firmicutes bacterium]|nr:hypothetical protein [Bacillota bacterium]